MTRCFPTWMKSRLFFPLALLFLLSAQLRLQAQCEPVAICTANATVVIGIDDPNDCYGPAGFDYLPPALDSNHYGGVTWVKATLFDDGSYDPCNNIKVTIQRVLPLDPNSCINILNPIRGVTPCNDTFPTIPSEFERAISESDSIKFYCCEAGTTVTLLFRAYKVDAVGNLILNASDLPIYDECLVSVEVQDNIKPASICPSNVTVSCENFDPTLTAYGTVNPFDNCCLDTTIQTVNYSAFDTVSNRGTIVRTFMSTDCNGNSSQCTQRIVANEASVSGKVFLDSLENCVYDNGEAVLANWRVKVTGLVTGKVYETLTDSLGQYILFFDPIDTVAEVTLAVPFNFGLECPSVYTLQNVTACEEFTQDIPAHLISVCPLLSVEMSAPFLRRCFTNTYTVKACNLSTLDVEDAHVELALDSYMGFSNSSIPAISLGNNTYSFDLGDLEAGRCTTFKVSFLLNCTAPLGYTHCTEAHIYPDTLCEIPANWSGADLKVTGFCDGDSVRLTITNIGFGDMLQMQDFVVVEDVVMYMTAPFQLNSGASVSFSLPANGATWRLETDEVPNHPWGGVEAKAVEGCGGLNTTGLVTMFSFNTPNPFETVDCQENIGAYDPNDKQAFPKGYGTQHFIEANTDLEYRIRFQNTGTDTAFTVVVLDTLSADLDAASVRPGASSHAYDFAALEGNVLRFRFDNILLPDSNVNQAASNGFVTFNVAQKTDNAAGTFIENRAAIYFDFNEPVLTNTTFHTIGDHFVLVGTNNNPALAPLHIFPNPSFGIVFFELPELTSDNRFRLTDNLGKTVVTSNFSDKIYRFEKGALSPGVYFYHITTGNGDAYTGKVILK